MSRPASELPTAGELEILQVLWERGPSTVRQVFREIEQKREVGYSTVLKLMQIMTDKGSVERDESVRPQIYRSSQTRPHTQRKLVKDLLGRAFDGSPGSLVLQALAAKKSSAEERQQIRELLDRIEAEESP